MSWRKGARLLMMYKMASENVAITNKDRLDTILTYVFLVFHCPSLYGSTRIVLPSYDIWLEPSVIAHSFEPLCWNIIVSSISIKHELD
jgi:hypothetical protein